MSLIALVGLDKNNRIIAVRSMGQESDRHPPSSSGQEGTGQLEPDSHLQFIKDLDGRVKKLDYWQADYLRMNGIYWALTSLLLLRPGLCSKSDAFALLSPLSRDEIIAFVCSCEGADGMNDAPGWTNPNCGDGK